MKIKKKSKTKKQKNKQEQNTSLQQTLTYYPIQMYVKKENVDVQSEHIQHQ